MKLIIKCPKCGHEQILTVNYGVMAILWATIVGGIIYSVIVHKRYKCKKCGEKMNTHKELTVENSPHNKQK